ncbi:MAG: hypothetical protein DRN92_09485, partial [Thermoproteota archaeon]
RTVPVAVALHRAPLSAGPLPAFSLSTPGGSPLGAHLKDQVLWDGRASGKKALVTIGCKTGGIHVEADGKTVSLRKGPAGETDYTTVYAEYVEVCEWEGDGSQGEYFIAVDIAD